MATHSSTHPSSSVFPKSLFYASNSAKCNSFWLEVETELAMAAQAVSALTDVSRFSGAQRTVRETNKSHDPIPSLLPFYLSEKCSGSYA